MRPPESGAEINSASHLLDDLAGGLPRPFRSLGSEGDLHLIVRAGGRRIAVPMAALSGVVPAPPTALLPADGRSLVGLVALGGEVVPVADLAALVGLGDSADGERLLLVVQDGDSQLALKVEAVEGHETLFSPQAADIDLSDSAEGAGSLLAHLPGRDDLAVIDIDAVLADPRIALPDVSPATGPEGR